MLYASGGAEKSIVEHIGRWAHLWTDRQMSEAASLIVDHSCLDIKTGNCANFAAVTILAFDSSSPTIRRHVRMISRTKKKNQTGLLVTESTCSISWSQRKGYKSSPVEGVLQQVRLASLYCSVSFVSSTRTAVDARRKHDQVKNQDPKYHAAIFLTHDIFYYPHYTWTNCTTQARLFFPTSTIEPRVTYWETQFPSSFRSLFCFFHSVWLIINL